MEVLCVEHINVWRRGEGITCFPGLGFLEEGWHVSQCLSMGYLVTKDPSHGFMLLTHFLCVY